MAFLPMLGFMALGVFAWNKGDDLAAMILWLIASVMALIGMAVQYS